MKKYLESIREMMEKEAVKTEVWKKMEVKLELMPNIPKKDIHNQNSKPKVIFGRYLCLNCYVNLQVFFMIWKLIVNIWRQQLERAYLLCQPGLFHCFGD